MAHVWCMIMTFKSPSTEEGGQCGHHEGPHHPAGDSANQNPDPEASVLNIEVGRSQANGQQIQQMLTSTAKAHPRADDVASTWPRSFELSIGRQLEGVLPVQMWALVAGESFDACVTHRALQYTSRIGPLPRLLKLPVTRGPVVAVCPR